MSLGSCITKKHHNETINQLTAAQKELAEIKAEKNKPMNIENEIDKVSYSLGLNVAQNIKGQGLSEINYSAFAKGVEDIYEGNNAAIDPAKAQQILQEFFQKQQEKQSAGLKEAGEKFLAENAKKEGVVVLPSGLQYTIMKEGTGEKPSATSTVSTHYHGTLITGEVFDSSVDRGTPAEFPVNRVIPGWTEALQLMPVGSKWKLFIPYDLAYGAQGAGGKIGPYSALVFEVELLKIVN